ncbi:YkvA family protein [Peribacillus alkalitolerans]|uniref:YkvA family protein n=1 Tax=Peribacillus alkalitolerans TaxID=1550385 RepID=UPI0013D68DD8|nr:DUF1232 domain-containing protein [Peribacillus alkalitolerans]
MQEPLLEESKDQTEDTLQEAEKAYSEEKLWRKLKKFSKKAGSSVVYACLLLVYTLQKPEVPMKTKTIIIGALGYFILPLDLIPDFAAGIGFTDDLGALGIALIQVAMHIDDEIKGKARGKLQEWFGPTVDTNDIDKKIGS